MNHIDVEIWTSYGGAECKIVDCLNIIVYGMLKLNDTIEYN